MSQETSVIPVGGSYVCTTLQGKFHMPLCTSNFSIIFSIPNIGINANFKRGPLELLHFPLRFVQFRSISFTKSVVLKRFLSSSFPQLDDCTLQLSHNGTYLDLESSLAEQRDELEGFQQDDTG